MKYRQLRQSTLIAARMHSEAGWSDVVIRNLSANGAMLQVPAPPQRGTYVEVRRGTSVIVGRTIWSDAGRCGIRTQDPVLVDRWLSGTGAQSEPIEPGRDRRRLRRAGGERTGFDARTFAEILQSAAITILVLTIALIALHAMYQRLDVVVGALRTAL